MSVLLPPQDPVEAAPLLEVAQPLTVNELQENTTLLRKGLWSIDGVNGFSKEEAEQHATDYAEILMNGWKVFSS